jgi:hypothetical protein
MKDRSRGSGKPDNGDAPEESLCPSQLLILSPLASEALALCEGLSRTLGTPTIFPKPNETVFSPYVTVQFLGPGPGTSGHIEKLRLSDYRKVLVAGFAGGLSDRAISGKAFIVSEVFGKNGGRVMLPGADFWSRLLDVEPAVSVEVEEILERPEEKQAVVCRTPADLADMESFAWMEIILKTSPEAGLLRVISDDWKTTLPRELMLFSDEKGFEQRFRGFAGLLKRPPAFGSFLQALPSLLRGRKELVVIGEKLGTLLREKGL